jgi:ERCC4-related helicase
VGSAGELEKRASTPGRAELHLTEYQTKYYAYELTKRCPADSLEKLAGALVDAQVDLNPHQVEAALFAFRSPFSKGAILADEVGLGKTIEAGLVLSQKWAERNRRILVITPSNLRKQWYQELQEKFFLPSRILETKSYNQAKRSGEDNPFLSSEIVICSYQFARRKADDLQAIHWNLVVIDEAHRLRNVYKPANVIARTLRDALLDKPKLLLTATPLQNSLLELYGLVSFIDERAFGDLASFREQFARIADHHTFDVLKARLRPICHRTLRRQVMNYINYTKRMAIVQPFTPAESEDRLYDLVSEYLRRDNLQALPASQRSLMTLVLRKLMASSTFAIAGALDTMSQRLRAKLSSQPEKETLEEALDKDFEALGEEAEEWEEDQTAELLTDEDIRAINREVGDLDSFRDLAVSIIHNAKGTALLTALEVAFAKAAELGAERKAIIFTESRRTQDYLLRLLADSPFYEGIVLFNGSNNDERSRQIYAEWFEHYKGTDRVTGSRTADMRSALVDYFRERGQIMIATEAGAEGINLQFCSLVVNYDLPWNPQRIEQRIGRCHRYGQKHDVVVVNFLNQNNEADQRVYKILAEKFSLFEGVFGASDEVLGAIESGVDFEKRINGIYQRCRTPEEISASFDQLQAELGAQISEAMTKTRQQLLENFDEEVHEKLRINLRDSKAYLNRYEQMLMDLTRAELGNSTEFIDGSSFRLLNNPYAGQGTGDIPLGRYELPRRTGDAHYYRLNHPLAEKVLEVAMKRDLPPAELIFDYSSHPARVSVLDELKGKSGALTAALLTIEALDQVEDYLIVSGVTDGGALLDEEQTQRLLLVSAKTNGNASGKMSSDALNAAVDERRREILNTISERNAAFFEAEANKIDNWADDLKVALEREIKELDRQIKEARRASTMASTLEEKLLFQKEMRALEGQRSTKRRALFDAQDEIDRKREQLISEIEGKMKQSESQTELFLIRWRIV